MKRLKVALLAVSGKSYGGETYYRALLPALVRHSPDVDFIVISRPDTYHAPEGASNISVYECEQRGLQSGIVRTLWEQFVLPAKLREMGADVVYTGTNSGILRSSVPCVPLVRNMEPLVEPWEGLSLRRRARLWLLRRLTVLSARRAALVAVVSQYVCDTLVEMGVPAARIRVVPHAVDDLPEIAADGGAVRYVIAAAKFIRYANLETLFRGFAKARELGYEGRLRFVGGSYDEQYEQEVKELLRALGIEAYVDFLGYCPRAQVQSLLAGADALLFSSMLEACPFTILEALHHGTPIVATTARPMPEFCQDAALYCEPKDHKTFGENAFRAATDEAVRADLRTKARSQAAKYTWQVNIENITGVFYEAAGHGTGGES